MDKPCATSGPHIQVKLWIESDGKILFGQGAALLLKGVERTGSLSGAAKDLKMSYRAAWGRIKKMEDNLGEPLLTKKKGNKAGYSLSKLGIKLLAAYEGWISQLEAEAQKKADELFPWPISKK